MEYNKYNKKNKILNKILKNLILTIQKHNLLIFINSLLISYSGGQDSMAILYCFLLLKDFYKYDLSVIFFNHLWHSCNKKNMEHVVKVCDDLKCRTFLVLPILIPTTENDARNWRHQSMNRLQSFYNKDAVVLGHTKSDKVETTLFNLCRGTGLKGFFNMTYKKKYFEISNTNSFFPTEKDFEDF